MVDEEQEPSLEDQRESIKRLVGGPPDGKWAAAGLAGIGLNLLFMRYVLDAGAEGRTGVDGVNTAGVGAEDGAEELPAGNEVVGPVGIDAAAANGKNDKNNPIMIPSMQEQEPAGICDEMWARKPFGISILVVMPLRGILLSFALFIFSQGKELNRARVTVTALHSYFHPS
eukprot:g38420.t1